MKSLFIKIVLPLAILSNLLVTKWRFGIVLDGTDEFLYGFPFISRCRGFATSLSTQYFIMELLLNFTMKLLFWGILAILFKMQLLSLKIHKWVVGTFYAVFAICAIFFGVVSNRLDDYYLIKRPFEVEVLDTGYIFLWQSPPDRSNYNQAIELWIEEKY